MKITTIKRTKEFGFPKLLENVNSGTIILATGWQTPDKVTYKGVCLFSRDKKHEIGEQRHWLVKVFKLFKGILIIEQE